MAIGALLDNELQDIGRLLETSGNWASDLVFHQMLLLRFNHVKSWENHGKTIGQWDSYPPVKVYITRRKITIF